MKVIRHAGIDSRMIILDDQARQQMTLRSLPIVTSMQRFAHHESNHTEPAWATEHNKSKYQATSLHEFGVVRSYRTDLLTEILKNQGL